MVTPIRQSATISCRITVIHRVQYSELYPSGIDSFSFMLSSAEVPTLLFQTRFACFKRGDFAYARFPGPLQRSLPGNAPKSKIVGVTFVLRILPVQRRL